MSDEAERLLVTVYQQGTTTVVGQVVCAFGRWPWRAPGLPCGWRPIQAEEWRGLR